MTTKVPNSMLEEFTAKACFKASLGGTDAALPTNSVQVIPFNTSAINVGNHFNPANYRFTPPAGVYRLNARTFTSSAVDDTESGTISIYKNGTAVATTAGYAFKTNGFINLAVSVLVTANGTDYFDARYFSFNLAGTRTLEGDPLYTSFEGEVL